MGWTGDAALVSEEFSLNFDAAAFLTQWAGTLNDAMHNTVDPTYVKGLLPAQVPDMTGGYHSDASWSTVWPTTLYTLYKAYGDTRAAAAFWGDLVLYLDTTVGEMGAAGIKGIPAGLGDWCPPGEAPGTDQGPKPDPAFSAGATFLLDVQHAIELGSALGAPEVPRLQALWGTLAAQFNAAWARAGYYGSSPTAGAQCAQAQAIGAGVVPPANLSAVAAYLVADIAAHAQHLSVGIIGQKYLARALTATGHADTAVDVLLQTSYPSFGWAFEHPDEPATALWELWSAPSEGPGMNSRAHVMQASVGAWLYTDVAGISQQPGSAGYADLLLWPRVTTHAALPFASGSLDTIRGAVALAWSAAAANASAGAAPAFTATATLPANARGEVRLPFPPGTPPGALLLTDGAPPATCAADAPEGATVAFACAPGGAVSAVRFASFGTPRGSCAGGFAQGACHAASSQSVVEAACLGQSACSVAVDAAAFGGDPCFGTLKHFDGAVTCSGGGSSTTVFANGSYVPGVAGVTGAWLNASASTLSVAVGSGTYNLVLSW
jgi:alpha-L-rhamnosidase